MSEAHSQHSSQQDASVDRGQLLLIVLVVLAIAASVVMLLTNSDIALKLALLAALWAAIIGFFLVVRYRNQAQRAEELYRAEARAAQQAERTAERAAAAAVAPAPMMPAVPEVPQAPPVPQMPVEAQLRAEDMAMLAEIRDSLAEMRERLTELSGQVVEYEPEALHLDAWRLPEITGTVGGDHLAGAPSPAAVGGFERHNISPELASVLGDAEPREPAVAAEPEAEPVVEHPTAEFPEVSVPVAEPEPEPKIPAPAHHESHESHQAHRHEEDTSHTGRRRADEGGLSVADLMARMKENK